MKNSWKRVPIKTVFTGLYDGPHATPKPSDDGPVFLGIKNLSEDGHLALDTIRHIAEEDFPKWTRRVCPQHNDIVFTYEATLNLYALIPQGLRCCLGRRLALVRPDQSKVDPRFLFFYFFSDDWRRTIATKTVIGSTVDRIPLLEFPDFPISLPDLSTQRKISGILSTYDELIENNVRRIAILEEMAQAIYREWFVRFHFPGYEKVNLINSPLGKIPEGWRWSKLKDVCDSVNYGYTASANKEVEVGPKFVRITDIVPSTIDWERVPYCELDADDSEKYALNEGDIVIARTGATTGYAKRLHKRHPKSVFASYLVRIVPSSTTGKHYVGLIVESSDYKEFIKRNLGGAAQPQANAQVLTSLDILVPTADVLQAFDSHLEPLADQKEILQSKNRNLRKTRDLLLPKLISGQLDVEGLDIETGEPLVEAVA